MSSLAATQADGYYLPPEYYDSGQYKRKSKNGYAGSKGHNQFVQNGVVRFEIPFDGFCEGCGEHVGKGTRFNASKMKAGKYFTTPIWEFRMRCRICSKCTFVVRTNPRERSFDYVEGIHQQVKDFNPEEAGTAGIIETDASIASMKPEEAVASGNPLARMEAEARGRRKKMTDIDKLRSIITINAQAYGNDVTENTRIRRAFRKERNEKKVRIARASKLGWKRGMELIPTDRTADIVASKSMIYANGRVLEKEKFRTVRQGSIFQGWKSAASQTVKRDIHEPALVLSAGNLVSKESRGGNKRKIKIGGLVSGAVSSEAPEASSAQVKGKMAHSPSLAMLLGYESD